MKEKILRFLRKKSVKHGIRTALCLLLALMATASDVLPILPPTEAEAADTSIETALKTKTLYKWTRATSYQDLVKATKTSDGRNRWVPVLISYKWTDDKGNTKEYILDLRTVTKTSDGLKYTDSRTPKEAARDTILVDRNQILAENWTDKMNTFKYPSLNGSYNEDMDVFWTADNQLTDFAIYESEYMDQEFGTYPTFYIGRDIDWSQPDTYWAYKGAKYPLSCYGSSQIDFPEPKNEYDDWASLALMWSYNSYRNWTFAGYNDGPGGGYTGPNTNLQKGEFRILAQHNNAPDTNLVPNGNKVYGQFESSYDTNGKFSVWTCEIFDLSTIQNTQNHARIGCDDSLQDLSGITPDVVIKPDQLFKISDDVRIAPNAVLLIQPGGTVTIDATLYNDGLIINYGTIFIREGGCIRTCEPFGDVPGNEGKTTFMFDGTLGRLICSGKYNGKLTGEGNLVMFKDSAVIFSWREAGGSNKFIIRDGATVELNGTIFSPNFIQLTDSDFHIRESGKLICQYECENRFADADFYKGTKTSSQFKLLGVGKSLVPVPIYEAGSFQFINEGSFKKLTEPSTSLPQGVSVAEFNEKAAQGCYLKNGT